MLLKADDIGANVKSIRKTAKESQEKFAEKINTSSKTISNIENGEVVPSLHTVANISEKYGCTIDSIVLPKNGTTFCKYRINETTVYDEDGRELTTYGIDAVDGNGIILKSFSDLSFERRKTEKIIKLCNEYKVALMHLRDIIEDNLIE